MGTAVAKRSIWAAIAENPFPHFDADTFRSGVAERLQAYADRAGGRVLSPPVRADAGEIFRLHLSDLPFPDGPGRGSLEVVAYKAFGRLYLSAILEHDRLFRFLDGSPGGRLYLNDFTFVRSYGEGAQPEPGVVDEALAGLERARHAVGRQDRASTDSRSSMGRIRVAVRSSHGEAESAVPAVLNPTDPRPASVGPRRQAVLDALRAEAPDPPQVRIRRRRPKSEDDPEAT